MSRPGSRAPITRLLALSLAALLFAAGCEAKAQQVIRLWPGKAPGTERWTLKESATPTPGGRRITNVSDPTLTLFLPERAKASGTAVIIAPGGGLRLLSEDDRLVEWLNAHGIAAFVLKYRILQVPPTLAPAGIAPSPAGNAPFPPASFGPGARPEMEIRNANANPAPNDAALTEVLGMGIADAQQALRLVRRNAVPWGVDPKKVGIMGFSAGGGVGIGAALAPPGDAYPDFLITAYGPSLMDVTVPPHAPPLFIVVGENHWNVTNGLLALFAKWKEAGKPAELHVYDMANGAIGMTPHGQPVDSWLERVVDWLALRGFAPATGRDWAPGR